MEPVALVYLFMTLTSNDFHLDMKVLDTFDNAIECEQRKNDFKKRAGLPSDVFLLRHNKDKDVLRFGRLYCRTATLSKERDS